MSAPVIVASTRGLTKHFGPTIAVRNIDIDLFAGEVYGFLGPNGAGKTTTIKLMLGLVRPTAGEVRLFDTPLHGNEPELMRRVGAIIEAPAFYPYLSGRQNLRALAMIDGLDERRVDEALTTVDLGFAADRRFDTYSLGMRQRLGIAATLLRDPALIFLDEPTSGLDPAGQREMRALIPRLAREGRTIFVSSHQMHELQEMCDRVTILKQGELVAHGTVESLLRSGSVIEARVPEADAARAVELLRAQEWVESVETDGGLLRVAADAGRAADVNRTLAEGGVYASELHPREQSLEEFFLDVTGEEEQF